MLVARNLSQQYPSASDGPPLSVLRNIDLEVAEAEVVAVLGPSGSGKTTLLGLLAGLDLPSSGHVELEGVSQSDLSEDERAAFRSQKLGFVFQNFQLIPTLTALENAMVPLELRPGGAGGEAAAERAARWLERVGLADRLGHYPAQLSGGEQQRVGLARAFANDPRLLFADEPTGNLDRDTGARIIDLLFGLNRQAGTTMVIATHDLALAERAHRVVHLAGGRIERIETTGRGTRADGDSDAP
jgi:putative ABC transport system ATP-binding protein